MLIVSGVYVHVNDVMNFNTEGGGIYGEFEGTDQAVCPRRDVE